MVGKVFKNGLDNFYEQIIISVIVVTLKEVIVELIGRDAYRFSMLTG